MRAAALGVFLVLVGTFVAIVQAPGRTAAAAVAAAPCRYELSALKTFSDRRRNLVYAGARPTTIIAINKRPKPRTRAALRKRGFERYIWTVFAQITDYRLGDDGAIHLILYDDGNYMRAALPAPACVPGFARARGAIVGARRLFQQRCGVATSDWKKLGAVAAIEGVGLWNRPHGQRGRARNYAELYPVTRIRFLAGCE